jgi:hypothetical protein
MSNEKVLTNTRNMRAELLVDPHATRKHFVVFFGVPLEFSALNLFRVFDWAAKSPTLLLYQQWLYLLIFHFFEPFLEYYKQ